MASSKMSSSKTPIKIKPKYTYDVITVGSATIDVFVKTDNELIKIKTSEGYAIRSSSPF